VTVFPSGQTAIAGRVYWALHGHRQPQDLSRGIGSRSTIASKTLKLFKISVFDSIQAKKTKSP
jgi:hypothetical protein